MGEILKCGAGAVRCIHKRNGEHGLTACGFPEGTPHDAHGTPCQYLKKLKVEEVS